MVKCIACGGSAETPTARVVNADFDQACGDACEARYKVDQELDLAAVCGPDRVFFRRFDPNGEAAAS